jgi:hypothetical protein
MKLAFGVLLLLAAIAAFFMLSPGGRLHAQLIPAVFQLGPQSLTFGMVGMANGQSARINALELPGGGPLVQGGSCQVTFTFYDDQGNNLATKTLPAVQNQSIHLDYTPTSTTPLEIRGTVQAMFTVTPGASTAAPSSCSVVPTMEIYDSTSGQTMLLLETTRALPQAIALTATR